MAGLKDAEAVCKARRVFYVLGLRRSGNHAFCNWLGCTVAPSLFCNNGMMWPTDIVDNGVTLAIRKPGHRDIINKAKEFGSIIYGLENFYPSQLQHRYGVVAKSYDGCLKDKRAQTVILVRDPFNTFASILRHSTQGGASFCLYANGQFAGRWTNVAQAALAADGERTLFVDFNRWASSEEYRKVVCASLGLAFDDRGFDHIPVFGNGSSFTGGRRMTDRQRAGLDRRWCELLDNEDEAYQLWLATDSRAFWVTADVLYPKLAFEVRAKLTNMARKHKWEQRYEQELGKLL